MLAKYIQYQSKLKLIYIPPIPWARRAQRNPTKLQISLQLLAWYMQYICKPNKIHIYLQLLAKYIQYQCKLKLIYIPPYPGPEGPKETQQNYKYLSNCWHDIYNIYVNPTKYKSLSNCWHDIHTIKVNLNWFTSHHTQGPKGPKKTNNIQINFQLLARYIQYLCKPNEI